MNKRSFNLFYLIFLLSTIFLCNIIFNQNTLTVYALTEDDIVAQVVDNADLQHDIQVIPVTDENGNTTFVQKTAKVIVHDIV